jgi:hypothetical protein
MAFYCKPTAQIVQATTGNGGGDWNRRRRKENCAYGEEAGGQKKEKPSWDASLYVCEHSLILKHLILL